MRCADIEEFHRLCESRLQHISLCSCRDSKLETSVIEDTSDSTLLRYPGCKEHRVGSPAWRSVLLGVEPSWGPVSPAVWHSPFRLYPYRVRVCVAGQGRETTQLRVLQISDKCSTPELYPQLTLWVIYENDTSLFGTCEYTCVCEHQHISHNTRLEDIGQGCGQFSSFVMQIPGMDRWCQAFKISTFIH